MYTMPLWHYIIIKSHYISNHINILGVLYYTTQILYYTKTVLYHTSWTTMNSNSQTLKSYSFDDQIFRQMRIKTFTKTIENLKNTIQS